MIHLIKPNKKLTIIGPKKPEISAEDLRTARAYVDYLVQFIFAFREANAYKDWSVEAVRGAVASGLNKGTLLLGFDPEFVESPAGIITCIEEDDKVMRVTGLIIRERSRNSGILGTWMDQLQTKFPGFNLESRRHGKNCVWNTQRSNKLIKKLGI